MQLRWKLFWIPFIIVVFFNGCSFFLQPPRETSRHPLIVISFDGFRWDYLQKAPTPNLDQLAANGVKTNGLMPIFPSKTFPNHYTIVTGLYAEHHGLVSNSMYDPVFDAYYRIRDRQAVSDARWYEGEPIWVTAQKQGLITASYFWVGTEAPIQGMHPTYWYPYDGSVPNRQRIAQAIQWLKLPPDKRPALILLYFSDTDTWGHRKGPDSPEVRQAIMQMDSLVGMLMDSLRAMGIFQKTNIMIVSDHGMTATSKDRVIFLDDYINPDSINVVDWSPVLAIWPTRLPIETVYRRLKNAHPHLKVYLKDEIPERFHYRQHRRIPPLIGIADEGWSITTRAFFNRNPERYNGGNHGYDNALTSMRAIFIAHGPDFKNGFRYHTIGNIHLYPLMAKLLGVQPAATDGSLDSVRALLN